MPECYKKMLATALTAVLLAASAAPARSAEGPQEDALLTVLHGIAGDDLGLDPDLPVDVFANGAPVLEGFTFTEIAGPLPLPPGDYEIDIFLSESEGNAPDPVISATIRLAPGENASVIAHLTEEGAPTASKYTNDVSAIAPLQSRIAVRHNAKAPTVDVGLVQLLPSFAPTLIEDLSNPEQAGPLDVPLGLYLAAVLPANERAIVFGPTPLVLAPRTSYVVYAVGSLEGTFTLLIQTIELPASVSGRGSR